jgi:predicted enzyme related to lactoylglutathione lyase
MKRVTGIGGIFLLGNDPAALREWYATHLGIELTPWGGAELAGPVNWNISSDAFEPASSPFMINYRVADLGALLATLRDEGCTVLDETDESEYGKFGWVIDPEGNKVELWEPPEG